MIQIDVPACICVEVWVNGVLSKIASSQFVPDIRDLYVVDVEEEKRSCQSSRLFSKFFSRPTLTQIYKCFRHVHNLAMFTTINTLYIFPTTVSLIFLLIAATYLPKYFKTLRNSKLNVFTVLRNEAQWNTETFPQQAHSFFFINCFSSLLLFFLCKNNRQIISKITRSVFMRRQSKYAFLTPIPPRRTRFIGTYIISLRFSKIIYNPKYRILFGG